MKNDKEQRQPLLEEDVYSSQPQVFANSQELLTMASRRTSLDIKNGIDLDVKPDNFEAEDVAVTKTGRSPPPYVASLTPEERQKAEKALVRKIDLHLIPPIIVM